MNIDEYVELSAKKIRNRKQREQFKKEMRNHILDRVEYYTDSGYDEETAIEKAIDHMGSAETVGTEMGKVHSSALSILADIIIATIFWCEIIIVSYAEIFSEKPGNMNAGFLGEFLLFIIMPLIAVIASRRGRHLAVMFCSLISSTVYMVFRLTRKAFCSQILFTLWLIVSGQTAKGMPLLQKTWLNSDSIPLIALSLIMFAAVEAVQIINIINAFRLSSHPAQKNRKIRRILNRSICIFTFIAFAVCIFAEIYLGINSLEYYPLEQIYFVDCDEMTDIKAVDYEKGFPIYIDYELFITGIDHTGWGEYIGETYIEEEEIHTPEIKFYPGNIRHTEFGRQVVEHTYNAEKRYVAVIPMTASFDDVEISYVPDYEHAKWFDTTKEKVLTGEVDGEYEDEAEYEITLTDNKEFIEAKKIYHINQSNKNR